MFSLNRFLRELITLRQKDPQDDLISALVQAKDKEDKLSEDELASMLFLLLLAGHETTVNLIGNGIAALLEYPDQLKKLTSDLSLLDSAIEEMLRFTNPVQHVGRRYALEDIDLCGQLIPKGSTVLVGIASANHDEAVFKNADQFDITRSPNRHVAFGMGIHYCLGAPLARIEAKVAFTALLTRFPTLKLAVPVDQLTWREGPGVQGLKSLPIHLGR
jgi:cytochrome P450 PksS